MANSRFFLWLFVTFAIAGGLAAAAHAYWDMDYAVPLTVATIGVLTALSIAIFLLGKRTADAENKFLFGNVFLGATMLKMFLCGGLIGTYVFLGRPPGRMFVIPFFTTYFTYTAFEIVFLVRLAGVGKNQPLPKPTE